MDIQPFPLPRATRETEILNGDGGATYGPFAFKIFDTADLRVTVRHDGGDWQDAAFTAAKVAGLEFDDFTIALAEPLTPTSDFIVRSARLHERQLAVTKGGAIGGRPLEKELSKQGSVIEELRRDVDRGGSVVPLAPGQIAIAGPDGCMRPGPFAGDIAAAQANAEIAEEAAIAAGISATEAENAAHRAEGFAAMLSADKVKFKTVQLLLADELMSYTDEPGKIQVGPGDGTEAGGFRYEVAASDAADWHVENANGVKLYYLPNNRLNIAAMGALGDGSTEETAIFQRAGNLASALQKPLMLNGGTYIVDDLIFSGDLEIRGRGIVRRKPGTTGQLLRSNASLRIRGNITIDPNIANCPNPAADYLSDAAIYHSGEVLDLDGVTVLDAHSVNTRTIPTKLLRLKNCRMQNGWMNVLASCGGVASVEIRGGEYADAHKDDGIQIMGAASFFIDGVEARGAAWSNITVNGGSKNGRISKCYSHGARIDPVANQGGWGIVCGTSAGNITITGNVVRNNQRGGITLDTYDPGPTDAHLVVTGNLIDGKYGEARAATGIYLNGCRHVTVTGNAIRGASQSILGTFNYRTTIAGNSMEDCGNGYFCQFNDSEHVYVTGNQMHECDNATVAVIASWRNKHFHFKNNTLTGLSGANRYGLRITDTEDYSIGNNTVSKADAGSSRIIWITGYSRRGRILGNNISSTFSAWQYYIEATGATIEDVLTANNVIYMPGIQTSPNRYILAGAAIRADSDNINGVKNFFSAAPTMFTPLTGAVAGIAGDLKMYDGGAWV